MLMSKDRLNYFLNYIVSTIYCCSISTEFRKPVECLYPEIIDSYLKEIQYPKDLGTILYNTLKDNYTSIDVFKRDLQLVFENAINFNKESPSMQSISNHLDTFAGGLFEEIMSMEYRVNYSNNNSSSNNNIHKYDFKTIRLSRRRYRVNVIKDYPLTKSEKNKLKDILKMIYQSNAEFHDLITSTISLIDTNTTICSIFYHIIITSCKKIETNTLNLQQPALYNLLLSNSEIFSKDDVITSDLIAKKYFINSKYTKLINQLDESLGVFVVCLYERKLRGCPFSSIWAIPKEIVWAQVIKENSKNKPIWWAGILLTGGKDTNFPYYLNHINATRVPSIISQQLPKINTKPKALTDTTIAPVISIVTHSSDIDIPDSNSIPLYSNYTAIRPGSFKYLVEFLGTHDFGWVKSDCILPFPQDGSINPLFMNNYNQLSMIEGIKTKKWLLSLSNESTDDIELPTIKQLENQINKNIAIDNSITKNFYSCNKLYSERYLNYLNLQYETKRQRAIIIAKYIASCMNQIKPVRSVDGSVDSTISSSNNNDEQIDSYKSNNHSNKKLDIKSNQLVNSLNPLVVGFSPKKYLLQYNLYFESNKKLKSITVARYIAICMNELKPLNSHAANDMIESTSKDHTTNGSNKHISNRKSITRKVNNSKSKYMDVHNLLDSNQKFDSKTYLSQSNLYVNINKKKKALAIAKIISQWMKYIKPIGITKLHSANSDNDLHEPVYLHNNLDYNIDDIELSHDYTISPFNDIINDNEILDNQSTRLKRLLDDETSPETIKRSNSIIDDNEIEFVNISTPVARLYSGEGVLHTNSVNVNDNIFYYEHKSCEIRKQILRNQLNRIRLDLLNLNHNSNV